MPGQHAVLSPSSSDRWLSCPASVRLSQQVPRGESSPYAEEGTTAHALGELEASYAFGLITKRQYTTRFDKWLKGAELADYDILEMRRHISDYVTLLQNKMTEHPHSVIFLEQRMDTGVDSCWGTGDAVIVSADHVEVIDLKYGAGVPVDAEGNTQGRLYGCGALDTFGDVLGDTETVTTTIFQPRLESLSSETLTAQELRDWRESIRPIAADALAGSDKFGPSEKACRWCPVSAICRVRVEQATKADFETDPDLLDNSEVGQWLGEVEKMRDWCNALESLALDKMYSQGETIPGYKVVLTNGRRAIVDPPQAIERLAAAGFPEDQVTRQSEVSMRTLGDLEKLVGKKDLPDILGDALAKSEGKPAVVRESDPRSPINPTAAAAADFTEEPE